MQRAALSRAMTPVLKDFFLPPVPKDSSRLVPGQDLVVARVMAQRIPIILEHTSLLADQGGGNIRCWPIDHSVPWPH